MKKEKKKGERNVPGSIRRERKRVRFDTKRCGHRGSKALIKAFQKKPFEWRIKKELANKIENGSKEDE